MMHVNEPGSTMGEDYPTIAAGIVTFHPDPALLYRLVQTLALRLDTIYLFNNAPLDPSLRGALASLAPHLRFIDAETNLGVGVALNVVALAATRDGFERLVVFDQDSRPWPGLVERLEVAFDQLEASRRRLAAVGPRLVAPAGAASKAPTYRTRPGVAAEGALRPVEFLPTSGSMFNLRTLRETGLFRADYFIDAIDLEWSFRAWAKGSGCWVVPDAPMEHTVGAGTIRLPFGLVMPDQKPFRMYCHLRNTLFGFRLGHVPLRWKLRQAVYMVLQILGYGAHHGFSRRTLGPLLAGLRDGVLGRLGSPPPESGF